MESSRLILLLFLEKLRTWFCVGDSEAVQEFYGFFLFHSRNQLTRSIPLGRGCWDCLFLLSVDQVIYISQSFRSFFLFQWPTSCTPCGAWNNMPGQPGLPCTCMWGFTSHAYGIWTAPLNYQHWKFAAVTADKSQISFIVLKCGASGF